MSTTTWGRGVVRRVLSAPAGPLDKVVADREPNRRPPLSNYIPNSDGEGGRVVSSGHPGGGPLKPVR